jgi:hypothetical protein
MARFKFSSRPQGPIRGRGWGSDSRQAHNHDPGVHELHCPTCDRETLHEDDDCLVCSDHAHHRVPIESEQEVTGSTIVAEF